MAITHQQTTSNVPDIKRPTPPPVPRCPPWIPFARAEKFTAPLLHPACITAQRKTLLQTVVILFWCEEPENAQVQSVRVCTHDACIHLSPSPSGGLNSWSFFLLANTQGNASRDVRDTTHAGGPNSWTQKGGQMPATLAFPQVALAPAALLPGSVHLQQRTQSAPSLRGGGPYGHPPSTMRASGGDLVEQPPIGEVVGAGAVGVLAGESCIHSTFCIRALNYSESLSSSRVLLCQPQASALAAPRCFFAVHPCCCEVRTYLVTRSWRVVGEKCCTSS